MKILLVNKSDRTGGAAIACRRLQKALQKANVDTKLLVEEKYTDDDTVINLNNTFLKEKAAFARFVAERLYFLPFEKNKELRFAFSPAVTGRNIDNLQIFQSSDIIHLHWVNQAYLSLRNIQRIFNSKKPIVWTLHDMWAFTGGCHYSGDCENYRKNCGNCFLLSKPSGKDLSYRILRKKRNILKNANLTLVACSSWLKEKAQASTLLKDFKIINIPNPIDTSVFYPKDKIKIRKKMNLPVDKKLVLFAAANINDKRKGLKYLLEALHIYHRENQAEQLEIITFGKAGSFIFKDLPYKVHHLGILSDTTSITEVYNAADVFVLPSLEDNLPNTIMESLACGTPVLAFHTGGIPEMIEHQKNGYLAEYKSSKDLKNGLEFILNHPQKEILKQNALNKVRNEFTEQIVARQYTNLYRELLSEHP